jgi:hypothetical protein
VKNADFAPSSPPQKPKLVMGRQEAGVERSNAVTNDAPVSDIVGYTTIIINKSVGGIGDSE